MFAIVFYTLRRGYYEVVVKQNVVQVYFCNIFNVNSVNITLCSLMELLSKFVSDFKLLGDKN